MCLYLTNSTNMAPPSQAPSPLLSLPQPCLPTPLTYGVAPAPPRWGCLGGIASPKTPKYDISKEKSGAAALFAVSSSHAFLLKRVTSVRVHHEVTPFSAGSGEKGPVGAASLPHERDEVVFG